MTTLKEKAIKALNSNELVLKDITLDKLNEYLKIVFKETLAGNCGMCISFLEDFAEELEDVLCYNHEELCYDEEKDDYVSLPSLLSKYGPSFQLGRAVLSRLTFNSFLVEEVELEMFCDFLDTPPELIEKAIIKLKKYFKVKLGESNKIFFKEILRKFIFLKQGNSNRLLFFKTKQVERLLKINTIFKEICDLFYTSNITNKNIAYGEVFEIFKNEEMILRITSFINDEAELENKIECENQELKEKLELFDNVTISSGSEVFGSYDKKDFGYGSMSLIEGSFLEFFISSCVLIKNEEIFTVIKEISKWE